VEARVLALRRELRLGADRLGPVAGVPARTVGAILARHGVPRLAECDPVTGQVIRSSKATAVRYERDRPGELVHMDVKKLGRIPDGGGWRGRGQDPANHASRPDKDTRVGYDYVHSLVDDRTRLAYSEALPDEKGPTCASFLKRAIAYFATFGITQIERLMTDNAWAYRHSLRGVCTTHGIRQIFIRPHCPWQNGKVERLNRTLQTEWAYRQAYTSNTQRIDALAPWIKQYNTERHHSAIGGPPTSRLSPT
jgi:transposase InsO family protein